MTLFACTLCITMVPEKEAFHPFFCTNSKAFRILEVRLVGWLCALPSAPWLVHLGRLGCSSSEVSEMLLKSELGQHSQQNKILYIQRPCNDLWTVARTATESFSTGQLLLLYIVIKYPRNKQKEEEESKEMVADKKQPRSLYVILRNHFLNVAQASMSFASGRSLSEPVSWRQQTENVRACDSSPQVLKSRRTRKRWFWT